MKKFLTKLILSTVCTAALATCLVGCGNNLSVPNGGNGGDTTANATNVESPLKYDTKYIHCDDVRKPVSQQYYYIFANNGTGKYHCYYRYDSYDGRAEISSYTINFKYVFSDAYKTRVTCFFDSVEYDSADNQKNARTTFCNTLELSENVIMKLGQSGYSEYVSESYLPQIPNYGVTSK